jgi:hypothetical protein
MESIAEVLAGLAHDCQASDQAEGIEGNFRAITIRIGQKTWRNDAVINLCARSVANGIDRLNRVQIVVVVNDLRIVPEGVTVSARKKEMFQRVLKFEVRLAFLRNKEYLAGSRPPVPILVDIDIAALMVQNDLAIREQVLSLWTRMVDVRQQTACERENVAPPGQSQRLDGAERQETVQTICTINRTCFAKEAPIGRVLDRFDGLPVFERQVMVAVTGARDILFEFLEAKTICNPAKI